MAHRVVFLSSVFSFETTFVEYALDVSNFLTPLVCHFENKIAILCKIL